MARDQITKEEAERVALDQSDSIGEFMPCEKKPLKTITLKEVKNGWLIERNSAYALGGALQENAYVAICDVDAIKIISDLIK